MLNTIPVMKGGYQNGNQNGSLNDNQIKNNIIQQMTKETDIEKGIREIDEKSKLTDGSLFFNQNTFESQANPINTDIAKSFHNMESKIFGKAVNNSGDEKSSKIDGFDLS